MASTPIYNWPTPDNTDLVRNGALAIRTLGDAIDTTTATMTPKSIVDAKGDLIAASANDTPARLAVGANGTTLVADSSTTTGLRWQGDYAAGKNGFLNANLAIWQRGVTLPITAASLTFYSADRFNAYRAVAGSTVSRQTTSDTTNLPTIQYCARVQRDNLDVAVNPIFFAQGLESANSYRYSGQTVTLSFWARRGADYSSASNGLSVKLQQGTSTDANIINGFGGALGDIIDQVITLTTTWQRFSITGTGTAGATQLGVLFGYTPTGTAGANDYFEVTGLQLELGSVATLFQTATGTIQGELAACQRYYWRFTNPTAGQFPSPVNGVGLAESTTGVIIPIQCPVTLRTNPNTIDYSGLLVADAVTTLTPSAVNINAAGTQSPRLKFDVTGAVQYRPYFIYLNGANTYLGIGAEL
jgi:hypothetical protein